MKIIIVPNEPNPNMTGRHYGIAKALLAAGHEVHTIMWDLPHQMDRQRLVRHLFTSLKRRSYQYEDIRMHHFGRLPLFWPYLNGWLFGRQLKQLYKQTGADIIFGQSFTNETRVPKSLPYIYDLADDYYAPADVFGSKVYKLAFKILGVHSSMRAMARNAVAVSAVSETLCDYARQYNSSVSLLPNGVEADIIKAVKRSACDRHSLLYVTGFGPWSQPLKLIDAVIALRAEFPDIKLSLVGEGPLVADIKATIKANHAEAYVSYHGFVHDRRAVYKLIQSHAIGLNISEKNAWRDAAHPMKVIEYSALGKKVVSTDLLGVTQLALPSVFTFSNDDPEGLQSALRTALLEPTSYYPKISRRILNTYDWRHIISQLEGLMQQHISRRAKPAIIHVTPSYPPVLGGLEKVVHVLAHTQAKAGHSVSVLTSKTSLGDDETSVIPVERFRNFVVANTIAMPGLFWRLLQVPKQDVVHLHITQALTPEMVWLAAKLRGFRYVAHVHLDVPASGLAGFLLQIYKPVFLKRVLQSARSVIVFTTDQRNAMVQKYQLAESRVKVIPNGAEDAFYYDEPRKLHKKPRLLFVGRLGYQKNIAQLLEALDGISQRFETTIVGDGELENELKQQAAELKLHGVTFAGRADGAVLLNQYRRADVFVLPSEREGMPLVLLEATAMGLPVIATDVTGSRDVIEDGKNGLLVPYGDATALRKALLELCFEPELYGRLQRQARVMAEEYSWRKLVLRFEPLYRNGL